MPCRRSEQILTVCLVAVSLLAAAFMILWSIERNKRVSDTEAARPARLDLQPVEVVKTVEVPKPVEIIKTIEVPAKLTVLEELYLDQGKQLSQTKWASGDDVLKSVNNICVVVSMNDSAKAIVSEERVKNKFELFLRQHSIKIVEEKDTFQTVFLSIQGIWDDNKVYFSYTSAIRLSQIVIVMTDNGFLKTSATTWSDSYIGFAGSKVAETGLLGSVQTAAESFANKYLAARSKVEAQKIE